MQKNLEGINVLLVDDSHEYLINLSKALAKNGAKVFTLVDGGEVLPSLQGGTKIDAVVLDVMMPGKDGYAVCAELKADEQLAKIPVILLTAVADHISSTRYSHQSGASTEADDYIPKDGDAADNLVVSIKRLTKK